MPQGVRQQQKDQTRREILSAAKELFLDLGYDHVYLAQSRQYQPETI